MPFRLLKKVGGASQPLLGLLPGPARQAGHLASGGAQEVARALFRRLAGGG